CSATAHVRYQLPPVADNSRVYLLASSFFFKRSRDHRDLHSFPTRRSSDLSICRAETCSRRASGRSRSSARSWRTKRWRCISALRSEEHTSELQSLRHLVCRLLLEKKNN